MNRLERFDRADRIAAEGLRGIGAVRAAKELERLPGALVYGTGAALSLLLTGGLVYAGYSYSQRLRQARKAREDAKKGG